MAVTICVTSALWGQPTPQFEVVSIRAVAPNAPLIMREVGYPSVHPGGQYIDPRTTLSSLIVFAYHIPAYFQLTGLPDWATRQSYSTSAKPARDFPALSPDENTEQVRLMMRALLAGRFHLKLHTPKSVRSRSTNWKSPNPASSSKKSRHQSRPPKKRPSASHIATAAAV